MRPNALLHFGAIVFLHQLMTGLVSPAPANSFRSQDGKTGLELNSRSKAHGDGETCPNDLNYCKCRARGSGLDITCENVNQVQLHSDCNKLKRKEHVIRYFKIRKSSIPRLDDHIFMGMKITHLYIHDSGVKSLAPNSLSSQGNTLSHLVLSKNELSEVPTRAIKSLKNLDHLNLNENRIHALRASAFKGLSKVTRLTLYHNQIQSIDRNAFDGLKRWHEEPTSKTQERDMQRLNLAKNQLTKIPHEALSGLAYLEILELTENKISKINPGDFNGLDSLDQLILNHNQISHLEANGFSGLPKLTTLYIDHNGVETINKEAFKGLEENLGSLTLTSNKIEEFPSIALRPIHGLTTFHIDDNKIRRLDEDAFQGFGEHIKFLWIQNNLIRDIPAPAFQDLHSLEWIKLYNNVLTTLHYELMEPVLDTLQHIDIHSNPLICDCELRWYKQWIEEEWNPVEEEWLQETFCTDPADDLEHNIEEVDLKDMYCTSDMTTADDGGGAASLFASSTVLIVTLLFLLLE